MNMMFKKSLSDLCINPGRTALVILALVIGLWGVSSLWVSYTILKNDLNENYLKTNPPHVIFTSKDFSRLDLTLVRNRPEIDSVEFRDLSIQRIEVFPNQWLPLWIFGVENFNHFNLAGIYSEEGASVPPSGTLLIERNGQKVSNLKMGSLARVRIGGKIIEVPISGISFDPAQAPATQDAFIYAYTDKKTYAQMSGEVTNQRLLVRFKNIATKKDIQGLANIILEDMQRRGIQVDTINIPKFNQHPHQFQLNTLLALQGSISLLALLMGAVLVAQLMGAILAQQIRQIGVLKAIGATRSQVLKIYMTMVLLLGAAASIIALPLGVMSGYAFAKFVADIINFNILTTQLPVYLYAALIAMGLLLPLLFALPALLQGVRISVYDALSDHGIRVDTRAGKAGITARLPLSYRMRLACRNTLRRKKRLAVTIATMALGVAIFSTGFNVRQSLVVFLADTRTSMKHDVQVVFKEQIPLEQALASFRSVKNIDHMEAWSGGRGRLQTGAIATANGIGIVALPYNTNLIQWDVIKGRWLNSSNETEIVMNQAAADSFGNTVVGEYYPITIKGKQLQAKLVGIVKEFEIAKIYIDKNHYDQLVNPSHGINSLMFVAKNNSYDEILALKKDIENAMAQTDFSIFYVMSQAERAQIIYNHLDIILTIITLLSLLVLIVSALGMASATGINIMERTREIGVMRAIGATPRIIYSLFVTEGMITSSMGIILGLLLGWPLSILASAFFGVLILGSGIPLQFAFSPIGFVITLVMTLSFGWLASRIPARKAISVSNREALSYE